MLALGLRQPKGGEVEFRLRSQPRVRAADSILDHSAKAVEIEDIEARVAELEKAAEAKSGRQS